MHWSVAVVRPASSTPATASWIITVTIALGHAAGQEVTAGRMGPDEAGAAYRDSVLRLVLNRPITEAD